MSALRAFLLPAGSWALLALALGMGAGNAAAQDADALATAARAQAWANRNAASAALFEQALAAAPSRRLEWLREYADQLTYSQRAGQAVPLFREVLAAPPSGQERQRALRGLGLALSWSDQNDAAREAYEALLAENPADPTARRDLGRVLSWAGRHRDADLQLRRHLHEHPQDREALFLLAQAQWWRGQADAARATLAQLRAADPTSAQALGLEQLMRDAQRPRVQIDSAHSRQSDGLGIARTTVQYQWTSDDARTTLTPRWQHTDYRPRGGAPGAVVDQPGLRLRHRAGEDVEFNLEAGTDDIRPQGAAATQRFVYSAWGTWWAADVLRLDLSSKRETFDNLLSLQRSIVARTDGLSLDWTPREQTRLSARTAYSTYSDGNQRHFGQLEMEQRLRTHPGLWAGLRATHVGFSQRLGNGYFNPLRFNATLLTLRAEGQGAGAGSGWNWSARFAGGRERANPDGEKPAYEAGVAVDYSLTPDTRLEFRLERFDSTVVSGGGFARTTAGLALVVKPGTR